MMNKVKFLLKRLFPLPARSSNWHHQELLGRIDELERVVGGIEAQQSGQAAELLAIRESVDKSIRALADTEQRLARLTLSRGKKIFAIACVKDESDVIESFCRYTLSYCDGLIIFDDGSDDGTADIIKSLISEGIDVYFPDDLISSDPSLAESFLMRKEAALNAMAGIAFDEHKADIVVLLDADEFMTTLNGSNPRAELELLDETVEHYIQWRTYIYEQEPGDNNKFLPFYFEEHRLPAYENQYKTIISKYQFYCMNARILFGQHYLEYKDDSGRDTGPRRTTVHDNFVLAHFPLRSKAQAMKKAMTFRKAHGGDKYFPNEAGWHLRKLYDYIQQHGTLTSGQVREMSLMYAYNLNEGETVADISTTTGVLPTAFCEPSMDLKYTHYERSRGYFEKAAKEREAEIINKISGVFVSVIIPVYNTAAYLEACLDSIMNQTYRNIEVICIDDGSTDNSLEILNSYAEKDSRFIVLTQPNQGQGAARNVGLQGAKGAYVYFMDSDDILDLEALDFLYSEALSRNLDILYFDGTSFYETELLKEKYPYYAALYERSREYSETTTGISLFNQFIMRDGAFLVSPCLQFIKREFLLKECIDFPVGYKYEDNVFALKCILQASYVSHKKRALFKRRIRDGSSTISNRAAHQKFIDYFRCYQAMTAFVSSREFDDVTMESIQSFLDIAQYTLYAFYREIPPDEAQEFSEMTVLEKAFFKQYMLPSINAHTP